LKAIDVTMTITCAVLYVVVGYLSYMGIVSPIVGVVRFWPAVIVPAVFATLFGPWVGGIGAAIGIFISDMTYGHQIAFLSLFAGVPANFFGFFTVGYLANKNLGWKHLGLGITGAFVITVLIGYLYYTNVISIDILALFLTMAIISGITIIIAGLKFPNWKSFETGCVLGLAIGAAWIGITLVIYSIFFSLPLTFEPFAKNAPLYAGALWMVWTFCSEIPFMILLGPPILEACYNAIPSLRKTKK